MLRQPAACVRPRRMRHRGPLLPHPRGGRAEILRPNSAVVSGSASALGVPVQEGLEVPAIEPRWAVWSNTVAALSPVLETFQIEQRDIQGAGNADHPTVVAGKGHMLARCPEVFARSKMERIERAHGVSFRKRLESSFQHRRNQFQERDTCDECPCRSAMGIGQALRVQPVPDFILEQPAGDQRLVPKRSRRASVFGQEVGKGDRRIQVDQRSLRSLSNSSRRSRNGATGSATGGAPPVATAGGVSHPRRTASARTASARIGLRVSPGGRSSATTRS